ncbi:GNAT family N-acetyltransferase [Pseudomonas sichuanensis]|uniref:acyl-homoserine-lactone synthase n=1 Tax=Pseudomonas sichuanensis TaxID=2213015 RepID=UPI00244CC129|nr:acyl-homoserine-lactone synthase [Pseudomonas sichuanensis]MDH0733440.1 GNAT family N-acetyltransferase [Pseudomonas sichuanensis]MDH1582091.1 GNAT family N-acetyltransferase [Pseudomonas sichuanensis]MDH1594132.1 GNAT family N-acetyltransferase [Pseudomonas sichuanensis]MDH1596536.1 GNAT family N-acetyltransferase [Pseudomonas sichuanensis]
MEFITGKLETLDASIRSAMAHYRYQVFVRKLGWNLDCEEDSEFDQFDRDDTVYILARDSQKQVVGVARLLSTATPYLLSEVFPDLLAGQPLPASEQVWELSRFAAADTGASSDCLERQISSPNAIALMQATLRCAAEHGARKLITVSPPGIERLLRKVGIDASRAGEVCSKYGQPLYASWITVN